MTDVERLCGVLSSRLRKERCCWFRYRQPLTRVVYIPKPWATATKEQRRRGLVWPCVDGSESTDSPNPTNGHLATLVSLARRSRRSLAMSELRVPSRPRPPMVPTPCNWERVWSWPWKWAKTKSGPPLPWAVSELHYNSTFFRAADGYSLYMHPGPHLVPSLMSLRQKACRRWPKSTYVTENRE